MGCAKSVIYRIKIDLRILWTFKIKMTKIFFTGFKKYMLLKLIKVKCNNLKPSCTVVVPKKCSIDFRYIPKLTCAKCGNRMMSRTEENAFLDKMGESAQKVLKRKEFDKYRNTPVFEFLLNISQNNSRTSLASLVKNTQNKLQIAQMQESSIKNAEEIVELAKKFMRPSSQVMNRLYKYRDKMPYSYKDFLDYMKIYSLMYPKSTFSEIFSKKEVIEHHTKLQIETRKQFTKKHIKAFQKFNKLSEKMLPVEQIKFFNLNQEAERITKDTLLPDITKSIMLDTLYKDFLDNIQDERLAIQIKKQIKHFPLMKKNGNDIIVSMFGKSDRDILKSTLDNISSTFEHVVAVSNNGKKSISNGLYMCKNCNQERSSIPYSVLMEYFPNFADNIQKQLNQIIKLIKTRRLEEYATYPLKIKKTLQRNTKNKINVDISKYIKYLKIQLITKLEATRILIDKKIEELNQINSKLVQNDFEIKQIKTSLKQLPEENKATEIKKLKKLKQRKNFLKKKLSNKNSDIANTRRSLKKLYIVYQRNIHSLTPEK